MVTVMALMLAGVSSPADDRAFQILSKMAEVLKAVERVELEVQFEMAQNNTNYKGQIIAQREPMRYWAKISEADGTLEYASMEGKTATYTDEGGNRKSEDMPSNRAISNYASAAGLFGWRLFLDQKWLEGISPENTFYVHEESVDGQVCDVVARRRTTIDSEQITTINYFWVNRATNLPEINQVHSLIRGASTIGPKWRYKNVKINPNWGPNPFPAIPEQVPTARRPGYYLDRSAKSIAVGEACPDLEVETAEYKKVTLASQLKGRTLLTFWAPWCGPCIAELNALKDLPEVKDGRLRVVALGTFDSKSSILKYAMGNLTAFQVLIDPEAEFRTSKLAQTFGVSGIPHAFLFGEDGKLIRHWVGFSSVEELTSKLRGDK